MCNFLERLLTDAGLSKGDDEEDDDIDDVDDELDHLGHTVTGVEGVPFVVEQFFRENNLEYDKVSLPDIRGWKYKVMMMMMTKLLM